MDESMVPGTTHKTSGMEKQKSFERRSVMAAAMHNYFV
jgi:hypothetical protein